MAVQSENIARLVSWFADGGPGWSHATAGALVERLGLLVFQGESHWPQHPERVDAYRDALSAWFAGNAVSDADSGGANPTKIRGEI